METNVLGKSASVFIGFSASRAREFRILVASSVHHVHIYKIKLQIDY